MTVDLAEIARYMRMGRAVPEGALAGRVEGLLGEALKTVRPARVWRRFPFAGDAIECGALRIDARGTFARHLAGCHAAYLACGTIGAGFDAFQRRASISSGADALIVQAIGAALVERLMDDMGGEIEGDLADGASYPAIRPATATSRSPSSARCSPSSTRRARSASRSRTRF